MSLPWPEIVRWLQTICLITWTYPVLNQSCSVWRLAIGKPERWDAAWAAFWLLALTQVGFSARWLIYPHRLTMADANELQFWALCYLSSALTGIGMVWTQGLRAGLKKNRQALLFHLGVVATAGAGILVA